MQNWLLKCLLSLHKHFQILVSLWRSSSPITLDSMTAMALARGSLSSPFLRHPSLPQGHSNVAMTSASDLNVKLYSANVSTTTDIVMSNKVPHEKQNLEFPNTPKSKSIDITSDDDSDEKIASTLRLTDKIQPINSMKECIEKRKEVEPIQTSPSLRAVDIQVTSMAQQQTNSARLSPVSQSMGLRLLIPTKSSLISAPLESPLTLETPAPPLTPQIPSPPIYGHFTPTLYTTSHMTFCCIQRPQPMYVAVRGSKKVSMYSDWRLATNNPNPDGLTSRQLLHSYKSRSLNDPGYAQCAMLPTYGGTQTHSSYWTYTRKKLGLAKKEPGVAIKGDDSPAQDLLVFNKDGKRHKLRLSKGGFKSEEKYEYVRGRGWGKYICEACGIRCKKPSMLKKHLRTHTDLRPYHCRHCRFSFKTKGNLTKHMKSKSHQKKCFGLGIFPVPVTVDDSQIDSAALEEQCRISREARIHDSLDGGADDDDEEDDEMDEDDDEEEDEDDEDEGEERSCDFGLTADTVSPRVLKRQNSVDDSSPGYSATALTAISESSSVSLRSQVSEDQNAPNRNIDAEIARSLLDLSRPRKKTESMEIVDEEAHRHAQIHLQSLITQLLSQAKPLAGLSLPSSTPNTSLAGPSLTTTAATNPRTSPAVVTAVSTATCQSMSRPVLSALLSASSLNKPHQVGTLHHLGQSNLLSSSSRSLAISSTNVSSPVNLATLSQDVLKSTPSSISQSNFPNQLDGKLARLSSHNDPPISSSTSISNLSLSLPPTSPLVRHSSAPVSPSILGFLPAYMSSRQAQRPRSPRTVNQGPIIGQIVRKDSQTSASVAVTPGPVLSGQPFNFNIPFPGGGSLDLPEPPSFAHPIPTVTVTDESEDKDLSDSLTPVNLPVTQIEHSATSSSLPLKTSEESVNKSYENKSNRPEELKNLTISSDICDVSSRNTDEVTGNEVKNDSNFSGMSDPKVSIRSALGCLVQKSSLSAALITASNVQLGSVQQESLTPISTRQSLTPMSTVENSDIRPPAAKRSRRLSSGKSRLQRQRSLDDDSEVFAYDNESSVFEEKGVTEASKVFQQKIPRLNKQSDISSTAGLEDKAEASTAKVMSCKFCAETFASQEAYDLHLRSQKHIWVLESLGILPAGTYQRLQQTEGHREGQSAGGEGQKHEQKLRKIDEEEEVEEVKEERLDMKKEVESESTERVKMEKEATKVEQTAMTDTPVLRRSLSWQEDPARRATNKRKIHQPEGTLLPQPLLNESLRQSLAKRARLGLAQSLDLETQGRLNASCTSNFEASRNPPILGRSISVSNEQTKISSSLVPCVSASVTIVPNAAVSQPSATPVALVRNYSRNIQSPLLVNPLPEIQKPSTIVVTSVMSNVKGEYAASPPKSTPATLRLIPTAAKSFSLTTPTSLTTSTISLASATSLPLTISSMLLPVTVASVESAAKQNYNTSQFSLASLTNTKLLLMTAAGARSSTISSPANKSTVSSIPVTSTSRLLLTNSSRPMTTLTTIPLKFPSTSMTMASKPMTSSSAPVPSMSVPMLLSSVPITSTAKATYLVPTTSVNIPGVSSTSLSTTTPVTSVPAVSTLVPSVKLTSTPLEFNSLKSVIGTSIQAPSMPVTSVRLVPASTTSMLIPTVPLLSIISKTSKPLIISKTSSEATTVPMLSLSKTSMAVTSTSLVSVSATSIPVTSVSMKPLTVTSVPVTPVPVTSLSVTPVPLTSVPVLPVQVTSLPVTSKPPVTSVPVTPLPVTSDSSQLSQSPKLHLNCGLCDNSFSSLEALKSHLLSHAEPRPYVCQFCDAGFTNDRALRTHLLTHGQDRPYICGNCGDTFARSQDLRLHYISHSSTSLRDASSPSGDSSNSHHHDNSHHHNHNASPTPEQSQHHETSPTPDRPTLQDRLRNERVLDTTTTYSHTSSSVENPTETNYMVTNKYNNEASLVLNTLTTAVNTSLSSKPVSSSCVSKLPSVQQSESSVSVDKPLSIDDTVFSGYSDNSNSEESYNSLKNMCHSHLNTDNSLKILDKDEQNQAEYTDEGHPVDHCHHLKCEQLETEPQTDNDVNLPQGGENVILDTHNCDDTLTNQAIENMEVERSEVTGMSTLEESLEYPSNYTSESSAVKEFEMSGSDTASSEVKTDAVYLPQTYYGF